MDMRYILLLLLVMSCNQKVYNLQPTPGVYYEVVDKEWAHKKGYLFKYTLKRYKRKSITRKVILYSREHFEAGEIIENKLKK